MHRSAIVYITSVIFGACLDTFIQCMYLKSKTREDRVESNGVEWSRMECPHSCSWNMCMHRRTHVMMMTFFFYSLIINCESCQLCHILSPAFSIRRGVPELRIEWHFMNDCHSESAYFSPIGRLILFFLHLYVCITYFDPEYVCSRIANDVWYVYDVCVLWCNAYLVFIFLIYAVVLFFWLFLLEYIYFSGFGTSPCPTNAIHIHKNQWKMNYNLSILAVLFDSPVLCADLLTFGFHQVKGSPVAIRTWIDWICVWTCLTGPWKPIIGIFGFNISKWSIIL